MVPRCVGAAALNILDFYEHFLTVPSLRHCRQLLLQECRSIQLYLDQYDNLMITALFETGSFLTGYFIEEMLKIKDSSRLSNAEIYTATVYKEQVTKNN